MGESFRNNMNHWTDAARRAHRAHGLYQRGRWVEAAAELRAALTMNPCNSGWQFNLAMTLEAMEDYDDACEAYARAASLDGGEIETRCAWGACLVRAGRYWQAIEHFSDVARDEPDYEPAYCYRIQAYAQLGLHEQAELMFYLARQIEDDCPHCFYHMGESFYARGEFAQALACWQRTEALAVGYPRISQALADAQCAMGQLDAAATTLRHALHEKGWEADVLCQLADVLRQKGLLDEARQRILCVVHGTPDDPAGYRGLAEIEEDAGNIAAAITHYRKALALSGDHDTLLPLARALLRVGERAEAIAHLRAALVMRYDQPDALSELGSLFLQAGCGLESHEALSRLAKCRNDDPVCWNRLAACCFTLGRLREGLVHARRALKCDREFGPALYNLAVAHRRLGHWPRARHYAARAWEADPANHRYRQLFRSLRRRRRLL